MPIPRAAKFKSTLSVRLTLTLTQLAVAEADHVILRLTPAKPALALVQLLAFEAVRVADIDSKIAILEEEQKKWTVNQKRLDAKCLVSRPYPNPAPTLRQPQPYPSLP